MTISPKDIELAKVASRCVPSQLPEIALLDTYYFLAHFFTFGELEDIAIVNRHFTKEDLTHALINAPSGIIDARSWAYWNLILLDLSPPPPMPTRTFPEETPS
jgi:hypothetical protein